jgi:hypothetical protein
LLVLFIVVREDMRIGAVILSDEEEVVDLGGLNDRLQ